MAEPGARPRMTVTRALGAVLGTLVLFPGVVLGQAQGQDADGARIVTTAAGPQYRAGPFHRWILGRHYRDLWTTPVRVLELDLDEMAGGLTPTRTGGGMQTRSLRFDGADGREYAFRSVDKDPSPVLDTLLRGTIVDDLVQDGISAAHPFGALVAAPLLDAVGILHVDPQLRVMPDDPRLGEFRQEFAGMLGLIEERPDENEGERMSFQGTERVISSETLTERLDDGPDDRVDAREYLKARLVDVFLGDWDRHRGQWRWATFDEDAPRRWLPVPRDRDQAFSKFDGLATRIVSLYLPQFVRFEAEYPSMHRQTWNGRSIDRWFLAELDRDEWRQVAQEVRDALTDDVIEQAAFQLPAEIYEINGVELQETLRQRREGLDAAWNEFYELLAREAEVRATDEDEIVVVDRSEPGALTVTITAPDEQDTPYFRRRFLAEETEEVRISVRRGDDEVVVRGDADPGITVRVVGGRGDDHFVFEGEGDGVRLYDHQGSNRVSGDDAPDVDDRPFDEWEWTPEDRAEPQDWGSWAVPILWSSYGTDVGFFVGGGGRVENYGFRNFPFASAVDVRGGFAPFLGKGRVQVDARFNRSNSSLFWTTGARVSRLDVLHYYGLGNETVSSGESFHRVDITRTSAYAGLGVSPEPWFELTASAMIERASTQENQGRFFETLGPVYGDGAFTSVGLTGRLVFDPLIGNQRTGNRFRLTLDGSVHPEALDAESTFGEAGGEISVLLASSTWPALALHLRSGARRVFGRFPWHRAAFVGGNGTVRGWDEQRFAGEGALFGTAELRARVLQPRVVVPLAVGLFGFADAGRVFVEGESPGGWHDGLGGGVFLQPVLQPYIVRLGAASSNEATKIFLSFGLPY